MPRSPSRAALAESIASIARRAAASSGTDPGLLEGYLEIVREVRRTGRGLTRKERDDRRLLGRRAAENNDTLTAYFRAGNATAAARDLHLSVRALTYRLARIHRLTGYDPTDSEYRYTLETAVLGARMLDWPEVTP